MLFHIHCLDKPDSLQIRLDNRPDHLAYLEAHQDQIVLAGPLLTDDEKPKGSVLVMDFPDAAGAEAFAAGDPYAKAGLFESVIITPYKRVFPQ